jgi:signal transduction histidine kinase/CheY-like chemotaxis protein
MKEVSCRHFPYWFEVMKSCGGKVEDAIARIPYPLEYLLNPSNRIDWSDYVKFTEDGIASSGGVENFKKVRLVYGQSGAMGYLRKLSGLFISPRHIYDVTVLEHGPSIYTHLKFTLRDLPDGRLQIEIRIPDEYEDCPLYFLGSEPAFATLPQLIGLPCAEITTEVRPRLGIFTVTMPESRSLAHRFRRLTAAAMAPFGMHQFLETQRAELKRLLGVLQSERDNLSRVIETFPDGILILSSNHVVFANSAVRDLLNLMPDAPLPSLDSLPFLLKEAIRGLRFEVSDGRMIEIAGDTRILFHERDSRLLILRDITAIQNAEDQIAMATLKERERLAHNLHDGLGQYFAALNYKAAALQTLSPDPNPLLEEISSISREASSLSREIVHGLGFGYAEGDNLVASLERMGARAARVFNLSFTFSSNVPAATVRPGTASDLFALLQEALTNTAKHSGCTKFTLDFVRVKNGWRLTLIDNGRGLDSKPPDGAASGLGLDTMNLRASRMGGTFTVTSAPGEGCRLDLFLPSRSIQLQEIPEPALPDSRDLPRYSSSRKRIFIVDDHSLFRQGVRQIIEARDEFEVCGESSNRENLGEQLTETGADALVLDLLIHDRIDFQTITTLRLQHPQIQIIILTMFDTEGYRTQSLNAGADVYLRKSDPPELLLEALAA